MSNINLDQHSVPNPRRSYKWPLLILGIALLIGGFYWFKVYTPSASEEGEHGKKGEYSRYGHDDEKPVVVSVETAKKGDFPILLNGLGTVTALKTVTVHSRVDGELIKLGFTEGQLVKEGDLLAEIDPRPFQVQLQQAEGQLLRDEALLKNAELDNTRYEKLLAQDSIASQQTVTQAALVKQYQGTVEMDKALVNNAKLQLTYARLTAPVQGRVGLRQIDQGNIIHAGDANGLVVITQIQPISVIFTLPEDKVQPLIKRWREHRDLPVFAYDRSGKNKLAEGKLTAIDNQIDPTTGTLKLKAQFDNNDFSLFANQFVNVRLLLNTIENTVLVSSAAIQHDSQGAFVYVAGSDNKVELRRVNIEPGSIDNDNVAVLNNLAINDVVIIEGIDRLKEGSKIDIAQKDGQAVAATPESKEKPEGEFRKR